MIKNMGSADRIIRLVIAAIAAYLYFGEYLAAPWGTVALVVGGIMLLTSLINFCPLYRIFGIRTCKVS